MKNKWFGCVLTSLAIAGSASAGDAAIGAQKAAVCGACHGITGSSVNPEWPNLAGQGEAYVVAQLQSFQQGARSNPLMTPMAVPLKEEDMKDLGAHFAQQTPGGLEADPSNWKAGEKIYRGGDPGRGIPACIRLPWTPGPRKRAGEIPGTSRPTLGLHLQPAESLQGRLPASRPATTSCRS
jgi:cytochrome c553